jgi:hypothetical protein
MQTENDTPKPEDSLQQETGEGCSGATYSASWVDFHGGARMKLHKHMAIEVQQGKMPNAPWYWYGVGGISRDDRVGVYPTKKEAQLAAVEHARSDLLAALNSLPNAKCPSTQP